MKNIISIRDNFPFPNFVKERGIMQWKCRFGVTVYVIVSYVLLLSSRHMYYIAYRGPRLFLHIQFSYGTWSSLGMCPIYFYFLRNWTQRFIVTYFLLPQARVNARILQNISILYKCKNFETNIWVMMFVFFWYTCEWKSECENAYNII